MTDEDDFCYECAWTGGVNLFAEDEVCEPAICNCRICREFLEDINV